MQAGAFARALELLATAEAGPLDELQKARLELLRAHIAFASGPARDAPRLLLHAARRLEPLNLELARETYLQARGAAVFAGRPAGDGMLLEISRAALALPRPRTPRGPADLLLEGLALLITGLPETGAPMLRQAIGIFAGTGISAEDGLRWGWMALAATNALWDDDAHRAVIARQIQIARAAGALDRLPIYLAATGTAVTWSGDFAAADSVAAEAHALSAAAGTRMAPYGAILLAALRGSEAEAVPLIEATLAEAGAMGQGIGVSYAHWAAAILGNGLGRYQDALTAARHASDEGPGLYVSMWALPELVEAVVRTGDTQAGAEAAERLAGTTRISGTDFGLGLQARCRALVSGGPAAESCYREAIDRLSRTQLRPELARAYLLYGEWLRRENRRADARAQLQTGHEMLDAMGMTAFAVRAEHELRATGETVRKRAAADVSTLTAQEAHIAQLARDGQTNPEIAAQLFLSARTVEWHLRKIFTKLGISSRRELAGALAQFGPDGQSA
jgi:DNA-binding CsgD family transcriptional regulator